MTAVSLSSRFAQRSHSSMKFSFISDQTTHSDNNDDTESVDKLLTSILSVSFYVRFPNARSFILSFTQSLENVRLLFLRFRQILQ